MSRQFLTVKPGEPIMVSNSQIDSLRVKTSLQNNTSSKSPDYERVKVIDTEYIALFPFTFMLGVSDNSFIFTLMIHDGTKSSFSPVSSKLEQITQVKRRKNGVKILIT